MADVLDVLIAEDFEVDEEGDRKCFFVKIKVILTEKINFRGNREIEGESQIEERKRLWF